MRLLLIMKQWNFRIIPILALVCAAAIGIMAGCSKAEEPQSIDKTKISGTYCNDPKAVNYNVGFPGTPDNSICIFPTEVFKGEYVFYDTIYDGNYRLVRIIPPVTFTLTATDFTKLELKGLCKDITLPVTADRFYKATIDSVMGAVNLLPGRTMCREQDTISGMFTRSQTDNSVQVNLTVLSDTGINYHRGTAQKKY